MNDSSKQQRLRSERMFAKDFFMGRGRFVNLPAVKFCECANWRVFRFQYITKSPFIEKFHACQTA